MLGQKDIPRSLFHKQSLENWAAKRVLSVHCCWKGLMVQERSGCLPLCTKAKIVKSVPWAAF